MAEEMTVERDHDNIVVTMPLAWIERVIGGAEFKSANRFGVDVIDHDQFAEDLVQFLRTSRGVELMIEGEVAFGLECEDGDDGCALSAWPPHPWRFGWRRGRCPARAERKG